MGNTHSSAFVSRAVGALDGYVAELGPDVIYDKSLGTSRFLKTVRCRHRNGYLVVKIFIKPDANPLDERYLRRLKRERKALQDVANAYSYQAFLETDKAGYLIRQWVASSLYDRISTRPFLTPIEKKWIAFQILTALHEARKRKISHGDIKSENILVTSWNWVYIADFSSFKPTYLPLDNPADFAFFYDTSGRRNCYVAPERFYTTEKTPDSSFKRQEDGTGGQIDGVKKDHKVTEAMDVFSTGCVLAELFLEGTALFTLAQLFKYRTGELDVNSHLAPIEDLSVRDLIKRMVALEPAERPTFDSILHSSRGSIFPDCFYTPLHDFVSSVNDLPHPSPFIIPSLAGNVTPTQSAINNASGTADEKTSFAETSAPSDVNALPTDSDRRLWRIWAEYDVIEPIITPELNNMTSTIKIDYTATYSSSKPLQTLTPTVLHLPNSRSRVLTSTGAPPEDGPALIVLSLVCANIRNCTLPSTKLHGLDLMLALSIHLTDEAKLDRLLPYVIELLHDDSPVVRASALRTTLQVLHFVNAIAPFNAEVFPRYLLPCLRQSAVDPDMTVRCISAQGIVLCANLAVRYLEMGQALKAQGALRLGSDSNNYDESLYEVSYDAKMEELQNVVADLLATLLVDPTSVVKRSVLLDLAPLCIFFGRQKTNDILLSHMITYLNDRDWLLRYAFYDSIVDVAACLGGRNLEEYIFPLMTQALSDAEESNVAKVLTSLTTLCELGLFQKMRLWELMSTTLPLLYHSNMWIKQGAASFISSAAKQLPQTDVWCILYPSLKHYLRTEIRNVDVRSVMLSLKAPLPRHIYDFALEWAMRSPSSQFWRFHRKIPAKQDNPKEAVGSIRRATKGTVRTVTRSEEDDAQLQKLEQLGMSPLEESKLVALKDYIAKSANSINSLRSRQKAESDGDALQTVGPVELQKLGVVPNTVFLGSRQPQSTDANRKSSNIENRVLHHASSFDQTTSGAPFEDLRRRLATINGSNTSLNSASGSARGRIVSAPRPFTQPLDKDLPSSMDLRPGSPTESIVSTATSAVKPRFSIGSTESQKAAPAIGSVRANAVGLLEAPSKMRSEYSPERTGMSIASFSTSFRGARNQAAPNSNDDGHENTLNKLLEQLYSDANKESHGDFGPRVHDGPVRRRGPTRQTFSSRDGKRKALQASLISHLSAHTESVNGIAVSPDHAFFVSCSDDNTVKVWDTARLERNVTSKARHTYAQHHSHVKCICILENSHCFASAAVDGSVHVVRVHVTQTTSLPKYNKMQVIREYRLDRPGEYINYMTHYNKDDSSNLVYATNRSRIDILDLTTMQVSLSLENPRHYGPVVSICLDKKKTWMVTVTLSGHITLWDLRFGLLLRSWQVGLTLKGQNVQVRQCVIHPTKGKGRWIMITFDCEEITDSDIILMEVWDIETAAIVECYTSQSSAANLPHKPNLSPVAMTTGEFDPASAIAALVASRQRDDESPFTRPPDEDLESTPSDAAYGSMLTAVVAGSDFGGFSASSTRSFVDLATDISHRHSSKAGFLVAGTRNRSIKLWDLDRFERSVVLVADEDVEAEQPTYRSTMHGNGARIPVNSELRTTPQVGSANAAAGAQKATQVLGHQDNLLRAHQDFITSIACIDSPFRGSIVSGDRSGVVKIWRVDGFDQGGGNSPLYT